METSSDKAKYVKIKVTQENVVIFDGQEAGGKHHNTLLKGFLKLQPKTLGTVLVINGVMILFFGILLTIHNYNYPTFLAHSGITYWGSLIYISAGSLSFAAQNKLNPTVMKASLGMNVFSAITAGLTILLMSTQLGIIMMMDPSLYAEYLALRIVGIMLVFTVPQFFISIYISVFACKATCYRDSTLVKVLLN